jgi:AmmeMemoRadiSam system protein B/AmmeMemoRadiSam system protein A
MRHLLIAGLVSAAFGASAAVRPPAVAGSFYTGDPKTLRTQVVNMLGGAESDVPGPPARALVVPHAGYAFSGPTAALAFARLPDKGVRRVILLGPSHHFSYGGGALPEKGVTAFETPLGKLPLDLDALAKLRDHRDFKGPARAHGPEHSLEVELPFIQVATQEARLVPIAVGADTDLETCTRMAEMLSRLVDDGTVVVASSDFTHHGRRYGWSPYDGQDLPDTLLAVGRTTAGRAAAMDPRGFLKQVEVSGDTVCGVRPVGVLTALLAHAFNGKGEVLDVTTSGHVSGSFDLSVTYAAIAFSGEWRKWTDEVEPEADDLSEQEGQRLVSLARSVLETRLTHDTGVAEWFAQNGDRDRMLMPAGAFVTLNNTGQKASRSGKLRACMGVIEADQPLLDAVVQAAVWAAQDPRFPPLDADELDGLEVEVSVLSPMRKIASYRLIEVAKHGVLMTKNGRRAVFLPQVAPEQGWDRDTMLEHLSAKAGLPGDAWKLGAEFEVFTAQVFKELE